MLPFFGSLVVTFLLFLFSNIVDALPQPQPQQINPNNPNNQPPLPKPTKKEPKPKHPWKPGDPIPKPRKTPWTTIPCPCLTYPDSLFTTRTSWGDPMITINEWTIDTWDVVDSTKMVDVVVDVPTGVSEMVIYAPTNVPDVVVYERPEDASCISASLATVVPEYVFSVAKREPGPKPASTPTVTAVAKATAAATSHTDHTTFVRGTRRRPIVTGTFALDGTPTVADAPGFVGVASAHAAFGHHVSSSDSAVTTTVVVTEVVSSSTSPTFTATVTVTEFSEVDEVSSSASTSTSTSTHKPRKTLSSTSTHKCRKTPSTTTHKPRKTLSSTSTHKCRKTPSTTTHKPRKTLSSTSTHKCRKTPSTTTHKPRKTPSTTTHKPRKIPSVGSTSTTVTSIELVVATNTPTLKSIPSLITPFVPPMPTRSTLDDAKEGCIECQDIFEDKGVVPPETWTWPGPVRHPFDSEKRSLEEEGVEEGGVEYGGRPRPKRFGKLIPVAEEESSDIDPAGLTVDVDLDVRDMEGELNDIDPAGLTVDVDFDDEDEDENVDGEVKDTYKVTTRRRQLVPPEVHLDVNDKEFAGPGLFVPSNINLTNNHDANGVTAHAPVEEESDNAPVKITRQLVPPEFHVTDPDILAGPSPFLAPNMTLSKNKNHTTIHSTTTNADDPEISIPADFVPYNDTIHTNTNNTTNLAGTDRLPVPPPGEDEGEGEPPLDDNIKSKKWHGSTLPKDFIFGETLLPLDKATFTGVFNRKFGVTDPAKSPLNRPADSQLASKGRVAGALDTDTEGALDTRSSLSSRDTLSSLDTDTRSSLSSLSPLSPRGTDSTKETQSPASPLINLSTLSTKSTKSTKLSSTSTCNCAHNKDAHHWRDTMSPMERATEICMSGGGCKITHGYEEMCVMVGGGPNPCACLGGAVGEWQSHHRGVWWLWSAVHCGGSAVVITER
ncbi:hypothetical protein QBC32DRAFT_209243 [Pseudoneurospora amorphoporcata]|uniref:Uncharacterized protein n=1 Tax=Pseudoneurospora amorphoporcata TaxID=241081 RepID=A0AAN6NZH7_9PEZI|nr:hypothetical protein QBC32DRAFT_209243 [Pseudoneurospora amorphoporcata]